MGGIFPIIIYMGMLRTKGVSLSDKRYIKGVAMLRVEVKNRVRKTAIRCLKGV